MDLLTIGEFSRITGLTVKALRFYHESGLLEPKLVDAETGYRYYVPEYRERAQAISLLKEMGFTLGEIKEALTESQGEEDLRVFIERKIGQTEREIQRLDERRRILESAMRMGDVPGQSARGIVRRKVPERVILLRDMTGPYTSIGRGFRALWRVAGRHGTGPGFALYHELEYREEPSFSAGIHVKKVLRHEGFRCEVQPAREELVIAHRGPYGSQGPSYEALFARAREEGIKVRAPLEERFIKGPGLIFPGNPQEYVTELVLRV